MGKKGGSSWLSAVKRAFRSPSKDEDNKKTEKRRWIFRRSTNLQDMEMVSNSATVEAAAAAAATIMVTTTNTNTNNNTRASIHYAAILIQTAFRGYLARRALRALKGVVKLQALVRGHNVRKQAKMTLRCMQALVRVQARVLDQRMRLSHEATPKSTINNTLPLRSPYLQSSSHRKSLSQSREASSLVADDWDWDEELKAILQRKQISMKPQNWRRRGRSPSMGSGDEVEERPKLTDQRNWRKVPWESRGRASTDQRDHPIKTVEIDTLQPYAQTITNTSSSNFQRTIPHSNFHHSPATPSPSKARPKTLQLRSASPRLVRDDKSDNTSQTPSFTSSSNYRYYDYSSNLIQQSEGNCVPNYMAATECAKARIRSQSAPRQRPSTPERERGVGSSAKKRLSFPVADPMKMVSGATYERNLRSPSFKSVSGVMEQQSNYSSCCTDSLAGDISPSSTTQLRRWLR